VPAAYSKDAGSRKALSPEELSPALPQSLTGARVDSNHADALPSSHRLSAQAATLRKTQLAPCSSRLWKQRSALLRFSSAWALRLSAKSVKEIHAEAVI